MSGFSYKVNTAPVFLSRKKVTFQFDDKAALCTDKVERARYDLWKTSQYASKRTSKKENAIFASKRICFECLLSNGCFGAS